MKRPFLEAVGTAGAFVTLVFMGLIVGSQHGRADSDDSEESKIQTGFAIAPVPLNLKGKNRSLVGLGSYIVNAQADCNGCRRRQPGSFVTMRYPLVFPESLSAVFIAFHKSVAFTHDGGYL